MIDILVPMEQEGTEAVVRSWLKQVGDRVEENDPLVELETDKVAVEVPAPASGILREILLHTDDDAPPGALLGRIAPAAEVVGHEPTENEFVQEAPGKHISPSQQTGLQLSPAVRRALLQHDIDSSMIKGTGRDGRITRADVDRAVEQATRVGTDVAMTEGSSSTGPSQGGIRSYNVSHDRMRLKIAENMLRSVVQAPHVTAVFEADFSAIIAHRSKHKEIFAKDKVKLTYTAYFLAAAAEAMKAVPAINSRWHEDRLEIFEDVNIGVGTALGEKGLVVPVVHRVQSLSLKEIARALDDLTERARRGALKAADTKDGTFTISNHGVSGSLFASPIIINQPQSAILGVGKLEKRIVVRDVGGTDTIQIRPMAYISLTIDHRVVDGYQTNAWLRRFVEVLESYPIGA